MRGSFCFGVWDFGLGAWLMPAALDRIVQDFSRFTGCWGWGLGLMLGLMPAALDRMDRIFPASARRPCLWGGLLWGGGVVRVRTGVWIDAACEVVWPLLTGSQMVAEGCFCFGVPKPVACELPNGDGAVGAERRCVSDRGVVRQEITLWEACERLEFRMVETDHGWGAGVERLEECFLLEEKNGGTLLTRVTEIRARGRFRFFRELMMCLGLKRVHWFVFRNWKRICVEGGCGG